SWSVRELPAELRGAATPLAGELFEMSEPVRARTRFERHNLLDPPLRPPSGDGWDLILCRNVLIYFGAATVERTLERLSGALAPGGWLLVGASEVVHVMPPSVRLRPVGGRFGLQRDPLDVGRSRPATLPHAGSTDPPSAAGARPATSASGVERSRL